CAAVLGNPTNAFGVPQFRPYSPIVPALCAVAATALGLVSAAALGARLSGHDLQYRARPAEPAADPDQRTPLAGPQPPAVAQPRPGGVPDVERAARPHRRGAERVVAAGHLLRFGVATDDDAAQPGEAPATGQDDRGTTVGEDRARIAAPPVDPRRAEPVAAGEQRGVPAAGEVARG